ncbi:MAG: ComEC/Rec2 family competence protein, partial [Hydrogenimonas sp.]|nr:ComEC/Rec2 family competence protein [Hydrogenimonas sp.]
MSFRLSEPTLIEGRREWGAFLLLCALIFALSISFRYYNYLQFSSQKRFFADADVLIQYTKRKGGREYEVLKLTSSDGLTFYTTSKEPIKDLRGRNITLLLFPKRVSFYDYLKTPYIPSAIVRVNHERSSRMALAKILESMHEDRRLQELFGALFFALPISKDLRDSVTLLGINHLLALSGFHMGLLWLFVYGGLSLLYTPFQNRLFPWRHRLLDVGLLTVIVLG